jgi:hypothetical protein
VGAAQPLAVSEPYAPSREEFERELLGYLASREAHSMTHSELERELEERGRELMRKLLQDHIATRSPGEAVGAVRDAQGEERTHRRVQGRELETVFGSVEVVRTGYGAEGQESLHPLDAALNLPAERYSLEVRRRAAEEASKNSFREVAQTLVHHTGAQVPKRQVEQVVARAAQDFQAFYARREVEARAGGAPSSEILVLSADAKGVVMRKKDLREATRKAAERRQHKLQTKLSKGEKSNSKRMATVAAVYTVAPYPRTRDELVAELWREPREVKAKRPRPEAKRVWASLEREPAEVIEEAFAEALRRDPERRKQWVAVVDGDPKQIQLLEIVAEKYAVRLVIVLDLIHVLGYVWKAARGFHGEEAAAEDWVREHLMGILEGSSSQVAAGMRRSATLRGLKGPARKAVDTCANYLLKYKRYLRYDRYLQRGFPIASGVVEGACRHLIKDRMDVTGARWSLRGAEAVLRLRALRTSQDFDEYWRFHEAQEYNRNHASKYADRRPPQTRAPASLRNRARLTRIK